MVWAIGGYNSPKSWFDMNPGERHRPKKSWVGGGGRKNLRKNSGSQNEIIWSGKSERTLWHHVEPIQKNSSILVANIENNRFILSVPDVFYVNSQVMMWRPSSLAV